MSAAENLMDLVSQLQCMESALTSLILESALKLASLTSASVFILIEAEDARRFSGSKHLIDEYLNRSLVPSERDFQVDVDLSSRVTKEFPPAPNEDYSLYSVSQSLKRRSTDVVDEVGHTATKRKKTTCPYPETNAVDLKPRILDTNPPFTSSNNQALIKMDSIDCEISDDSDIEILESEHGNDFAEHGSDFSGVFAPNSRLETRLESTSSTFFPNKLFDASHTSNFMSVPSEAQQFQLKVEALRSVKDPFVAFQKGTVEFRLLTSVFYDYGKELKTNCPFSSDLKDPRTKTFFMDKINEFMNKFPNLQFNCPDSPVAKLKIEVGAKQVRKYTPEAFARVNARNGFVR